MLQAGSSFGGTTTTTSLWDSCLLDNLTLSASSPTSTAAASSAYTFKTPRDPDPMLNLPNTRTSRNATPDPFDEPISKCTTPFSLPIESSYLS
jgi:hypothetical protein